MGSNDPILGGWPAKAGQPPGCGVPCFPSRVQKWVLLEKQGTPQPGKNPRIELFQLDSGGRGLPAGACPVSCLKGLQALQTGHRAGTYCPI
eukprot:NODE_2694_length_1060_cov_4.495549_g2245_i0.p1 GENE.NODE_2694_length_1060_cov_4.495549_g2245_i0~~NODE_2694_length_1060_cov_4.495549_g2245_i0.p1  ORF type:complete len:91 (-),score=1.78 NODE_2694_length_1060_cov_4.495549_g2245_i0:566-838(-)